MSNLQHNPSSLDIRSFAQLAAQIRGNLSLSKCERLAEDLHGLDADLTAKTLSWQARGESVAIESGAAQTWLHLDVQAELPLQCQRCLQPINHAVTVQRSFRFVRDESEAHALDEDTEEDLLVVSKQFDLLSLVEDELLLALPFSPSHTVCPESVTLHVESDDFEQAAAAKPHAFAALGALKKIAT
jgi:uncharacterized protein